MKYLVLILCSIFSSVCVLQAQSYNEIVEQAMECVKKDSLVQAEQLFRKALKLEPNNARNALLFSNLGTVQKRLGKTDEAIESYSLALNIIPYSTAMLLNRAALYLEKDLLQKAYLDYCNVIDLVPKNQEARLFRAYIYMQRREYKEARVDYNVVLEQDVKNKTARIGLAMLDEKEGRFQSAMDAMNRLVSDYPQDVSVWKMRANMEWEHGQLDAALYDLDEVLKLDARDAASYVMKGDIYLELKRKSEARDAYEKAITLGVSRAELLEKLKQCK
ncbi:tetratricopeptide repeat protein [Bacteroides mediterraneensis]|uniref:tetratricopeptide repeat protein n=1 Tax=Bacteroides mediterraneensis TaxID=1841856 RepID=UPI0009352E5E|nr:tetratricopeptide repeat protein [Bacteroides mediterraneensis]